MTYLGCDHGGLELKEQMKHWLDEWGMPYEDVGAYTLDPADDYPQFAFTVAERVARDPAQHKGIVACRSAAGVVIAANKVKGIRAVAAFNEPSAQHAREHNDANVLGLSGDWLSPDQAKAVAHIWLTTAFSGEERHQRRINAITNYETSQHRAAI